ncbi:contact-dependent growth inhibition system immunity protein [Streptomyces sp. SL13]|uniref:Contact-dependent growth inhibition system immunity protein n=1 Tax=Streptantibioticus silvisoli TaxID=2705255 RepID=A0AA90K1V7_9ACTN|nr:contact-dependent growth inhibition system immunity protein [Streptantibioticus silvisoli]MDI5974141.1 contact-dependent growth inhibition system immunity protein [Streptantibioticus silvisoli]
MEPLRHDRDHGELDQVLQAYLGQEPDDTPETRSAALDAYLRHTWHVRPWALATAEQQLRGYAASVRDGSAGGQEQAYAMPDTGIADGRLAEWLEHVADHIRASVEHGDVPHSESPVTHWEWHARFPELAQLLGGWFSQDMPDEFAGHDEALADYAGGSDRFVVARLLGELTELVALALDESDYAVAVAELGMEVDPPVPFTPGGWLASLPDRLRAAAS